VTMLVGTRNRSLGIDFAPSLRFLAYVSFCPDVKGATMKCITCLRRTCETIFMKCRAISPMAEKNFESNLKMMIMPEYAVPYMLHLLSYRRETPDCTIEKGMAVVGDLDEQHKLLKKRLRCLLQPLVHTLGDRANNISFLLRQTELMARYKPLNPFQSGLLDSVSPFPGFGVRMENSIMSDHDLNCEKLSMNKLIVICLISKDVLLQLLKKDVNLTTYPGTIQFPRILFSRFNSSDIVNTIEDSTITTNKHVISESTTQSRDDLNKEKDIVKSRTNDSFIDMDANTREILFEKEAFSPNLESMKLQGLSPIPQSDSSPHDKIESTEVEINTLSRLTKLRTLSGTRTSLIYTQAQEIGSRGALKSMKTLEKLSSSSRKKNSMVNPTNTLNKLHIIKTGVPFTEVKDIDIPTSQCLVCANTSLTQNNHSVIGFNVIDMEFPQSSFLNTQLRKKRISDVTETPQYLVTDKKFKTEKKQFISESAKISRKAVIVGNGFFPTKRKDDNIPTNFFSISSIIPSEKKKSCRYACDRLRLLTFSISVHTFRK